MRLLILNTDYPQFIRDLYQRYPHLKNADYNEQMRYRNESLFGTADFYSRNLNKLGHNAIDIHINNPFLQSGWEDEYGQKSRKLLKAFLRSISIRERIGDIYSINKNKLKILENQISYYDPDVLWIQDLNAIDPTFLKRIKRRLGIKIIGQHAGPSSFRYADFTPYDFMVSAFPPNIKYFKSIGLPAHPIRLGFERSILDLYSNRTLNYDVTFIGSLSGLHQTRIEWLECISERIDSLKIWTPDLANLPPQSNLRHKICGQSWGKSMYSILYESRISLNSHGDLPPYAANMRLFEATGMGTLLITDWKKDLCNIFEIDKEIITYKNKEECVEWVKYFLEHEEERKKIAEAGQSRTLREHTYFNRMVEMDELLKN